MSVTTRRRGSWIGPALVPVFEVTVFEEDATTVRRHITVDGNHHVTCVAGPKSNTRLRVLTFTLNTTEETRLRLLRMILYNFHFRDARCKIIVRGVGTSDTVNASANEEVVSFANYILESHSRLDYNVNQTLGRRVIEQCTI